MPGIEREGLAAAELLNRETEDSFRLLVHNLPPFMRELCTNRFPAIFVSDVSGCSVWE
jgi:hypothetical protein